MLAETENAKKHKYHAAATARRAAFTPLIVTDDGAMEGETEIFMKRIGERLAAKWDKSISSVMGWIRSRLSMSILRASNVCLRGSRTKWRCAAIEEGASISLAS